MKKALLLGVLLGLTHFGFAQSIWATDFIKTKDGQHEAYLRSLRANWEKARVKAIELGYVKAYRVLTLPGNADWDVVLMTEYADRASFDKAEEHFQEVFRLVMPNGPTRIDGKGPRELADIRFSKEFSSPIFSK